MGATKTIGQYQVRASIDEVPIEFSYPVGMIGIPEFWRVTGLQAHRKEVGAGRAICKQNTLASYRFLQFIVSFRGRRGFTHLYIAQVLKS